MFNVLTRTNSRPNYFFLCHESVKNQDIAVNHIVSIDTDDTMEYLKYYDDITLVHVEKTSKKSGNDFPYNLYLNVMNQRVHEGWVMILDDDDIFSHNNVLKRLKKYITNGDEDTVFLWKVKIGSRVVPSEKNFKNKEIKRSDMSNIGFMYHSKHKNLIKWQNMRGGDFKAIMELCGKLKTVWINEIFTQTNDNSGNFGNKKDKYFKKSEKEKYNSFIENYNNLVYNVNEELEQVSENVTHELEEKQEIMEEVETIEEDETVETIEEDETVQTIEEDETVEEKEKVDDDEKVYILKESSIKAIATMLASAIDSKMLYEQIINKKYLHNNLISENNVPEIILTQPSEKDLPDLQVSQSLNDSQSLDDLHDLHDLHDSIDCYYIMYKNVSKDNLNSYYVKEGIPEEKLQFFDYDNINFTIIDICQEALKNNYESILIINEESNVLNNFSRELHYLCNNQQFNKCDIVICGQKNNFNADSFKVKQRKLKTKKINNKFEVNILSFDHDFYLSMYKDLDKSIFSSHEKSSEHFKNYGAKEGRYCCREYNQLKNISQTGDINAMILNRNAIRCLSECPDPTILQVVIQKEFSESIYQYSPYLFETKENIKERIINQSLYNYK